MALAALKYALVEWTSILPIPLSLPHFFFPIRENSCSFVDQYSILFLHFLHALHGKICLGFPNTGRHP